MSNRPNQQSRPTSTNATPADKSPQIFKSTSPMRNNTASVAKSFADSVRKSPNTSSVEKFFRTDDAPVNKGSDKSSPSDNQLFSGKKSDNKPVSRDPSTSKKASSVKGPQSEQKSGLRVPATFLNPKSAEKDYERKSAPGSERRVEGGRKSNLSKSPIVEEFQEHLSETELKKNLNMILGDKETVVNVTARRTGEEASGKKERSATKEGKSSKAKRESDVKAEDFGEAQQQEDGQEGQAGEGQRIERKEYSLYEDWRIIKTVEDLMKREVPKLASKSFWGKVVDPETQTRLLENRSADSLKDRWKKYLSQIDEAGKETIEEWLESHSEEEMKSHYCVFKKVDGVKQFTGISAQLAYNPEKIQRKTPYNSKPSKKEEKPYKKKGLGKVEDSFEDGEKDEIIEQHLTEEFRVEDNMMNMEGEEFSNMVIEAEMISRSREPSKQKPKLISSTTMNQKPYSEIPRGYAGQVPVRRNVVQRSTYIEEEKVNVGGQERGSFMAIESVKNSKRRKADEYERGSTTAQVNLKEMKRVRLNEEYDDRTLQPSIMFAFRKPCENRRLSEDKKMEEEDLMVYVDLSRGFRQFVKFDREEERKQDKRRQENLLLAKLADRYHVPLNEVAVAFRKVSYDYEDLEEYLQKKDPKILWTEEEDTDLIENNPTAIKYLRQIKGDEKLRKRREYLERVLA